MRAPLLARARILLVAGALATTAAAADPRLVPGSSTAAFDEQVAIAVALMDHARAAHGCLTAQVLGAELVGIDEAGTTLERWRVTHCGSVTDHRVVLRPTVGLDPAFAIDEDRTEVVLPKAVTACEIGERDTSIESAEERVGQATTDEQRVVARLWVSILTFGCFPRPNASQIAAGVPVVRLEFARDGRLVAHRLERSSGNVLIDAEATYMWARVAAKKRKLKLPKGYRPGEDPVVISLPVPFRAY